MEKSFRRNIGLDFGVTIKFVVDLLFSHVVPVVTFEFSQLIKFFIASSLSTPKYGTLLSIKLEITLTPPLVIPFELLFKLLWLAILIIGSLTLQKVF